ncbi:unnamed protein product [Arabis nemorensis]|uniref:Large ribosomal subunit protein eL24-related N-terminal domain-containing protein n=1 Tax=Arabis nemorensis TaxID=586526 RepID=A0A565AWX7_9BRAS|nr:unnamed protein product [Arabis nemorensis]
MGFRELPEEEEEEQEPVLKTELCRFSGHNIYPGRGIRFIPSDSQYKNDITFAATIQIINKTKVKMIKMQCSSQKPSTQLAGQNLVFIARADLFTGIYP